MLGFRIPQRSFEDLLLKISGRPGAVAFCEMGISDRPELGLTEYLYHRLLTYGSQRVCPRVAPGLCALMIGAAQEGDEEGRQSFLHKVKSTQAPAGLLVELGDERVSGYFLTRGGTTVEGAYLSLPGPGMEKVALLPLEGGNERGDRTYGPGAAAADAVGDRGSWERRYDRLAGAIGDGDIEAGFRTLLKARTVKVTLIGSGRAGSWVAARLAQSGVAEEAGLVIVDPDVVELPNLDGMLLPQQALGMSKAEAVAATVTALVPTARPIPMCASLNDREVVDAVRTSDVVFTTVDDDAARAAVAILASHYHLVHIDVSGGSAWTGRRRAVSGGELRVSTPGTPGCLACMGSYDWRRVEEALQLSPQAEGRRRSQTDWHVQRPGSNIDILFPLIGEALQCFWNVLKGRLTESVWVHYEKDSDGRPRWKDWSDRHSWGRCPVCAGQAGLGDLNA